MDKILKVLYNCTMSRWDYYRVNTKTKKKKTITSLFYLAGDGFGATAPDGRLEGRLIDDGDGYDVELAGHDIRLDYSDAHALLLLLQQTNPDIDSIERYDLVPE